MNIFPFAFLEREPDRKIIAWYFYILLLDGANTAASAYITVTLLARNHRSYGLGATLPPSPH